MTISTIAPGEETTRPRKQRWGWVLAVVLVGGLAFTVSGIFPFRQMLAQQRQVQLTEAKHDALAAENRRLEGEIAALQTDQEVERLARDQYGLVRPGETGYAIVPPPGAPEFLEEEGGAEPEIDKPWWQRVWDFISGGDVSGNG